MEELVKERDKVFVSKLSVEDAQESYRDDSKLSWRILRYIQSHPKACERTNGRMLINGLLLNTRGEGSKSGLECRLSKLIHKGIVLKVGATGSGKGQRANYKINYYHPELPVGLLDLAPEEEKEKVEKCLAKAKEQGGVVDEYGAITVKKEAEEGDEEMCGNEVVEEEEKSKRKENMVEIKKIKGGISLTINLNINLEGGKDV